MHSMRDRQSRCISVMLPLADSAAEVLPGDRKVWEQAMADPVVQAPN
jgi:hypothetical protein